MDYRVAIVGATGAVGQELLDLLTQRSFPVGTLRALASKRSAGKTLAYTGGSVTVEEATPEVLAECDIAIFSAGAEQSRDLAPDAARRGCVVIDNSSAFRLDESVPLVVPEINPEALEGHRGIIANPNCSTAIALMALAPLHLAFGLERVFAATYQAVSGSGAAALAELDAQTRAWVAGEEPVVSEYPHPIAFNLLPHVDRFLDDGYTKEEMKMLHESRKILGLPSLKVSTTCVRVPVRRAHSIALHAEFSQPVEVAVARAAIEAFPGVELVDEPANNRYPMPLTSSGKELCAVGRIRKDLAFENGLALWAVGDQLWKGAALNAVQIAETLVERGWVKFSR